MNYKPSPSIEARLLTKGPQEFYALASMKHQAAVVHGKDEIIVAIGSARLIMVPNGLRSLDPYNEAQYNHCLAAKIADQHLILASIPFDPSVPFALTVPEIAVQYTSEQKIIITTDSNNDDKTQALLSEILDLSHPETNVLNFSTLQHLQSDQDFANRVDRAIRTINNSEITKIVLAKTATLKLTTPLTPSELYLQMAAKYPDSYLFAMGNWVGASPELVISLKDNSLASHPLAGTSSLTNASKLLLSQKDQTEHRIVVTQIINRLSKLKINIPKQPAPTVTRYGRIVHLASKINCTLDPLLGLTSIELAARVAPTAAVCGDPSDRALDYIKNEEFPDRGFFGGLVGYQKNQGDGSWVLNIRAIELSEREVTMRAGVGIISESDPEQENAEANSKISSILDGVTSTAD